MNRITYQILQAAPEGLDVEWMRAANIAASRIGRRGALSGAHLLRRVGMPLTLALEIIAGRRVDIPLDAGTHTEGA